jgi:sterol desaturase/sphingolipid hydroxylase (fatty acid hydroxylase superfamily)
MKSLIVYSIPAFFILIAIELIIDKIKKTHLYRLNDMVSNINTGIVQQVTGVLLKILNIGVYIWIYDNYRITTIPLTWYSWVLLLLGVDFFYYWFHRLSHEVSVLWGTHVVHHQSEEYNLSVALRQSATQVFGSFWFYLPLAFIGFDPVAFITVAQIQTLYQFWIHTRLIKKMPAWFEFVFNTPSHHRVHHGVNPKYIDKNHGGTFIIYDRIFGTFQEEEEEVHYGITSQLKSWNIAIANFDYYGWIVKQLAHVKNIKDFFLVLLKPPGWRPAYLGGPIVPKEIDTARQLYDADTKPQMHIYIVIQFALLLAFVSYFLFGIEKFGIEKQIVGIAFIVLSTITIGTLFEQKKWAAILEVIRLLLAIPVLYFLIFYK